MTNRPQTQPERASTLFRAWQKFLQLACFFLGAGILLAAPDPCRIEKVFYRGWETWELSNGLITLNVAPAIGGRVIQARLGAHPFFFVNPELAGQVQSPTDAPGEWKNFGGDKLWPAPQGWQSDDEWPGPPDLILDAGCYRAESIEQRPERVSLRLISPPDARTGLELSRTIQIESGSTRVLHECVMKNISRRPVAWAIWQVSQQDTADEIQADRFNSNYWVYTPLNPRSIFPKGFYPLFGQATHPSYQPDKERGLFALKYEHRVGKVGIDSSAGWLAAVNGQTEHAFVASFPLFPDKKYAEGSAIQFWLNGAGEFFLNGQAFTNAPDVKRTPFLLETEILSPITRLEPGESYHFPIAWFLARCPKPVLQVTPAGAVSQSLAVTLKNGNLALRGCFGVFHRGQVEAIVKASDGRILSRAAVARANPSQKLVLQKTIACPSAAFRVTLRLLDEQGDDRGELGNARIEEVP